MLKQLLVPDELLQLNKLDSAKELCQDSSFLAIVGSDSLELANTLSKLFENTTNKFVPKTNNILQEIIPIKDDFVFINMYDVNNSEYIKNLLFYRDFIADNRLKIILLIDKKDYLDITKNAIDLYNITTFSYLFSTYKVDILRSFEMPEIDEVLAKYHSEKKSLYIEQKLSFLYEIGRKYDSYGDYKNKIIFHGDNFLKNIVSFWYKLVSFWYKLVSCIFKQLA
jgi:hypothetical protein